MVTSTHVAGLLLFITQTASPLITSQRGTEQVAGTKPLNGGITRAESPYVSPSVSLWSHQSYLYGLTSRISMVLPAYLYVLTSRISYGLTSRISMVSLAVSPTVLPVVSPMISLAVSPTVSLVVSPMISLAVSLWSHQPYLLWSH